MSTSPTAPVSRGPRRPWALGAGLLLLLLVAASCSVGLGWLGGDDAGSHGAAPTSTVTVTVTEQGLPDAPRPVTPTSTSSTSSTSGGDGSVGAAGGATGRAGTSVGSSQGSVDAGARKPFTMTAGLSGGPLLLGQQRSLVVAVSNPNPVAITVLALRVAPGTPNHPGCHAEWLTVGSYAGSPALTVAAHGTTSLSLPIRLVDLPATNQNACKNATFPLALTGTARS